MALFETKKQYESVQRMEAALRAKKAEVEAMQYPSADGTPNVVDYLEGYSGVLRHIEAAQRLFLDNSIYWTGKAADSCYSQVESIYGKVLDLCERWKAVVSEICEAIERERQQYGAEASRLAGELNIVEEYSIGLSDMWNGKIAKRSGE